MSTRKIKNARDLDSNELIYFKSHAQATFMSDGSTVEDVINEIKETGGADLTDYVTTAQLNTSLGGKQDTISDLADIRSGASKGATAVQPASVATAVTINGINKTISSNKINIGTIPTAVTINNSTKTGSTIALGTVVTSVTMNGSAKTVNSGVVDLGTVITAHQALKTINGQSIVGSGNITIEGDSGNSDANVAAVDTGDVLDDVNVDYATTAYVDGLIGDINSVLESIINGGITYINISIADSGTTDLSVEQIREIVQYCNDIYGDEYNGPATNFKYTFNNIKLNTISYLRWSAEEGDAYIIQAFTNNDEGELFIEYVDNSLGNEQVLSGYFVWNE